MSFTVNLYHIVLRTKFSRQAIPIANEEHLYRWLWAYIRNHGGILYRVGGMPDHVHILVDLPPKESIAHFVMGLKASSSKMMTAAGNLFPDFCGWGKGYYAATVSPGDKERIRRYIQNQKAHHGRDPRLMEEIRRFLEESGLNDAVDRALQMLRDDGPDPDDPDGVGT